MEITPSSEGVCSHFRGFLQPGDPNGLVCVRHSLVVHTGSGDARARPRPGTSMRSFRNPGLLGVVSIVINPITSKYGTHEYIIPMTTQLMTRGAPRIETTQNLGSTSCSLEVLCDVLAF